MSFEIEYANDLPPISFIAGTNQELDFYVYDSGSTVVDLTTATCVWRLCPYGYPDFTSASKLGVPVSGSPYIFTVSLLPSDTVGFSGVYLQQPTVTDFLGKVFKPSQGLVNIKSAIP